jgi:hypothetical protein
MSTDLPNPDAAGSEQSEREFTRSEQPCWLVAQ